MGKNKRVKEYISQKCFPTNKLLNDMIEHIEDCSSEDMQDLLKIILCSGYRIGEVLNSYLYFDEDKNITIRAVVEKAGVHKMTTRGYMNWIPSHIHDDIWKSNPLKNYFKLSMGFIDDIISDGYDKPNFSFKMSYSKAYKLLNKTMPNSIVYYFKSEREVPVQVESKPAFHFYRKAFVSKMINDEGGNYMRVINYMGWKNVNQIKFYSKLYQDNDLNGARDLYFNSKKEDW